MNNSKQYYINKINKQLEDISNIDNIHKVDYLNLLIFKDINTYTEVQLHDILFLIEDIIKFMSLQTKTIKIYDESCRESGYGDGWETGYEEGYDKGEKEGVEDKIRDLINAEKLKFELEMMDGIKISLEKGKIEGYESGYEIGFNEGNELGVAVGKKEQEKEMDILDNSVVMLTKMPK